MVSVVSHAILILLMGPSNTPLSLGHWFGPTWQLDDTSASGLCYKSIPPTYPALSGRKAKALGVTHNLMKSYVSMTLQAQTPSSDGENRNDDEKGSHPSPYGEVMDITGFLRWISGGQP